METLKLKINRVVLFFLMVSLLIGAVAIRAELDLSWKLLILGFSMALSLLFLASDSLLTLLKEEDKLGGSKHGE